MKRSLRQILADSHIAAVTIAVLLLWSLDDVFHALLGPVSSAIHFLFDAVAILDFPSHSFTSVDRFMLLTACVYSFSAVVSFSAAWLVARWVYGEGPIRSLTRYSSNPIGRNHV